MSDTAVAVTTLTANTVSADILTTAEGGTAVSAGDVAVIAAEGETRNLIITLYAASAATCTVDAGDNPPAIRQGLGALASQSIPAGDTLMLVLEGARFAQDDGTVRINIVSNTVVVGAHRVPDTV